MSDCERLSDRMPEVATGRAGWSTEEASHLMSCADCGAEWELVQAARRLEARAPAVDAEAIAAGVQRRLASERASGRAARWLWAAGGAAAAAAIAIALSADRVPQPEPGGTTAVAAGTEPLMPLPELDGLETAQLDTLLQVLDGPLVGTSTLESSTLSDEADAELELILASWEG